MTIKKPRLVQWKETILKMVTVEKDLGFEVDVRAGFINFMDILEKERSGKLSVIEHMKNQVSEYPIEHQAALMSLLHEAECDIDYGNI